MIVRRVQQFFDCFTRGLFNFEQNLSFYNPGDDLEVNAWMQSMEYGEIN